MLEPMLDPLRHASEYTLYASSSSKPEFMPADWLNSLEEIRVEGV